jgi:[protein-PII] uridylyltransferase
VTTEIREAFARVRARVEELQGSGVSGAEVMQAHSADVDVIVVGAFESALSRSGRDGTGIALVALGGYGRNELAPCSDLDLLVLYNGWSASDVAGLNREVMYPLWDSGRELGDRVREPRDVIRSLTGRVDEVCALLDARLLAGDRGLFADLDGQVRRRLDRGRHTFFKDLVGSIVDRHRRYGHAGHLLEPNIRDSAGGLRDIHTLEWAAKLMPGAESLHGLSTAGFLSELDARTIMQARSFLLRVRIELHLATNRHQDQLYLPDQDDVARRLGYAATDDRPSADRLMQELYRHARQVAVIVDSFWDRTLHAKRRRFRRTATTQTLGDGCVLQDGRIEVLAVTHSREDPAGWLRVFRRSVRHGAPVGRAALNRLHEELADEPELEWSTDAREVFLDLIQGGTEGVDALEAMDLAGFLQALIPEWEPIRGYPQRDIYHRYTVDRHLFAAVGELAESRSLDEPDVRDAWGLSPEPEVLFLATLLHDLGKGRNGDHSIIGAELARSVGLRMNLEGTQLEDLVFLVREHLTLVTLATRRDLNDARTIAEAAERIVDPRRLAGLFLLTRADSLATGPEAWSSFRSSLVRELYAKTKQSFQGVVDGPAEASQRLEALADGLGIERDEAIRLVGPMPEAWLVGIDHASAGRQLDLLRTPLGTTEVRTALHSAREADEFIVVAHDRPGMFSSIAGVLSLRGIDVHDAEIYTRSDGVAVEVFRVIGSHGAIPEDRWARARADIPLALDGRLDLDAELGRKTAQTRRRRTPQRQAGSPQIVVDHAASDSHTVVEVHTEDRLGLLRAITKALTDAGCDLSLAKVATYGPHVVDVFYVRNLEGRKITDPDDIRRIEESLRSVL